MEIKKVENNNSDFSKLCKKLDDIHNEIVAEQRSLGANCCVNNEKYTNVYIMYDGDYPAGCLAFTNPKDGIVEIGRVCVYKEYRKHGIATKLFDIAEEISKNNGATTLILDTYERLEDAVKLYKKIGFKIVPQFSDLKDSPFSICLLKDLQQNDIL